VPIFFSERSFEVVTLGVGHRGLLLRSVHIDNEPRVEIWFKPVEALCLSTLLDGVHITTPRDPDRLPEAEKHMRRKLRDHERLYAVVTQTRRGWVVGGSVSGRQDQRGVGAPTMFDGWEAREGVEELFSVNVG